MVSVYAGRGGRAAGCALTFVGLKGFVDPTIAEYADSFRWFDVPTVGLEKIENLRANGAKILAIDAGETVIVDREKMIAAADRAGIVGVGRK